MDPEITRVRVREGNGLQYLYYIPLSTCYLTQTELPLTLRLTATCNAVAGKADAPTTVYVEMFAADIISLFSRVVGHPRN